MSDVFVSYKAEDRGRIAPLVQALEADGLSVWWDTQIAAGSDRVRVLVLITRRKAQSGPAPARRRPR